MSETDRYTEHVDERGILRVPVAKASDPAPTREGFKPWWVNIVGGRNPEKLVYYKPAP